MKRDLLLAAIKKFEGKRYELAAYVVMDDQVHALLTPFATYELQRIVHSLEIVYCATDATPTKKVGESLAGRVLRADCA